MFNIKLIPENIQAQIAEFRASARAGIDDLENQLDAKMNAAAAISRNVCLEDVATLIESDIKTAIEKHRFGLAQKAKLALSLARHGEPITQVTINGVGDADESERSEFGSFMFAWDFGGYDALAFLWTDSEIKKYAIAAAKAAGAKTLAEGGLRAADARQQHAALNDEIRALITARKAAIEAVSGLVDVALQPFVARKEPSAPPEPQRGISIMRQDPDGVMRPISPNEPFGGS